jgi:Family of unknown function (DUF6496)
MCFAIPTPGVPVTFLDPGVFVMATKYGKKAQSEVKEAMHEMKEGTLKSGKSNKKVTNPKQAVAIGLSKARKAGGKVPAKKD